MKKFVFTLMLAACAVVLAQAGGLRAYNLPEGGYVVLDGQDEIVAVGERGTTADMSIHFNTIDGGAAETVELFVNDTLVQTYHNIAEFDYNRTINSISYKV